ncbi:hypothetical protein [Streptomyces sp. NPDC094468]|uniref:hypothetical protein n=1 Tax=Streptomyces sp. NPDC094468 TaxID=3366066 RepID=UPI0037FB054D
MSETEQAADNHPISPEGSAVWHQPLPWASGSERAVTQGPAADAETVGHENEQDARIPNFLSIFGSRGQGVEVEPEVDTDSRVVSRAGVSERLGRVFTAKVAGSALLGAALLATLFILTPDDSSHATRDHQVKPDVPPIGEPETDGMASPSGAVESPHATAKSASDSHRPSKSVPLAKVSRTPTQDHALKPVTTTTPRPEKATKSTTSTARPISSEASVATTLQIHAGRELAQGTSWHTNLISVTMQTDGNFVVYNQARKGLWSTRTNGYGYRAVMEANGNFTIYNKAGNDIWNTGTDGHPGAYLCLQKDGNVTVLYRGTIIWAAGTHA